MKLFTKIMNYFVSDKTIQLTKLEILNETVEYYSADPSRRGLAKDGDCKYNGDNGTHCPVGRCLLPKYKKMGENLPSNNATLYDLVTYNKVKKLDNMLEKKYRGHEQYFWRDLQSLHDKSRFWDESGITADGEEKVKDITNTYNQI